MDTQRGSRSTTLGVAVAAGAGLALGLSPLPAAADFEACAQQGNKVCYWDTTGFPGIPYYANSLTAPGTAISFVGSSLNNTSESVCNNTGSWVALYDGFQSGGKACIAPGAGTKDLFIFKNLLSSQETAAGVPGGCLGTVTTPCCSA